MDLIDRQAAIDAADKIIERDTSGSNAVVNAMIAWSEYIRTLPSAQPVATDTNVGDIISRQAAIDVLGVGAELLRRVLDDADIVGVERAKYEWGLGLIESYIADMKELPSAQPYTVEEIQKMQENEAVQLEKAYELGRESVQPKQEWIPVSERLPEDGENVLVTYKTTDKIHPCQYHDDGSRNPWYSYIDQCREHMNVVLAWMPLPEPAKLEND